MGDGVAADIFDHHEGQLARHARTLQPLHHPHQRHAHRAHLRLFQPAQQLDPAEREQRSVERADRFVEVGQGHHERDRVAIQLGDHDQILEHDRFQLLAGMRDFGVGDRHEAPILAPGVVQYAKDDRRLLVELRLVDIADANAAIFFARLDDALNERGKLLRDIQLIGLELLDRRVSRTLDHRLIGRAVMPHHHRGRMVMPVDQQPRLFPDGQRNRPQHPRHALRAQPLLGRRDQRLANLRIRRLEQAEIAGARPHALFRRLAERKLVDMRGHAPHDLPVAARQKILRSGMAKKGILPRRQQFLDLGLQRRNPAGVLGIEPPGQVDKRLHIGLAGNGSDNQISMRHGCRLRK